MLNMFRFQPFCISCNCFVFKRGKRLLITALAINFKYKNVTVNAYLFLNNLLYNFKLSIKESLSAILVKK